MLGSRRSATVANALLEHMRSGVGEAVTVVDLRQVAKRAAEWSALLPRVTPHYAVKCNPDLAIASTLAECGVNFDCASATEMDMIVSKVGVSPDRVIYAHPTKAPSQLRYAVDNGVDLTVVDSIEEVEKLAALHPTAKIVVRIKVDDSNSAMPFSAKFGADLSAVPAIMDRASKLGMAVVGVSYHVGSGCEHPDTFYKAVGAANTAFGYGKAAGHAMTLLNLGGGYPGRADPGAPTHMLPSIFPTVAARINAALNEFFPESRVDSVSGQPIRVIAEPGRYFVSSCQTMATPIIAQRIEGDPAGDGMSRLYISDGVYGSFNCVIFDQQKPSPSFVPRELLEAPDAAAVLEAMTPLAPPSDDDEVPSQHMSVWGPTCDSVDLVVKDLRVPLGTRIGTGDWFVWDNMGAYTNASASTFNGFHVPNRAYIPASAQWDFEGLVQEVAQELHQHQPTPFSQGATVTGFMLRAATPPAIQGGAHPSTHRHRASHGVSHFKPAQGHTAWRTQQVRGVHTFVPGWAAQRAAAGVVDAMLLHTTAYAAKEAGQRQVDRAMHSGRQQA